MILKHLTHILNILPNYLYYKLRFIGQAIEIHPTSHIGRTSTIKIFPKDNHKITIGAKCWIENDAKLVTYRGDIIIGKNSSINDFTVIRGGGKVIIGNNVRIGPNCTISGISHRFDRIDIPISEQGAIYNEIIIEDDVWIGANSCIVSSIKIKKGSVIGAGSVVTKDIPEYSVAVGNPARIIRTRTEKDLHT